MNDRLRSTYHDLKDRVRNATYTDLRVLASRLRSELPDRLEQVSPDDILQMKALVLLCEVYDYYGMFGAARECSSQGPRILSLRDPPRQRLPHDELLQAKVRLMVAHARSFYRSPKRTKVIELLLECRAYVGEHLANDTFPCYGTLGEIAYTLGRAYRQRQRYADALREFTEAIRLYDERARHKRRTDPLRADEAEQFSAHKVSVITALGVAWCNYTQGALQAAMFTNLVPARAILRQSQDVLNRAYADVIGASITRGLAGSDASVLEQATQDVTLARDVFAAYGHEHYEAGATLELALLALARKNKIEARKHLERLRELAAGSDFRWRRAALIIESRIQRREGDTPGALSTATRALKLARKQGELIGQLDALIARSESYTASEGDNATASEGDNAIEDLKQALRLNARSSHDPAGRNPKVYGICHLHLVRHYLARHNLYYALASFAHWQSVRDRVEHRSIHEKAEQLAKELDRHSRLEFRGGDDLNYKNNCSRLEEFLLRQARRRCRTQEEMAVALGISRALLVQWIAKYKIAKS
jgi:tetratricopeptide (TPR) repeat protein